uniref:Transcription repressor n=1 Tax=Leersia perrieri TaxID=77586 RepID=A0A0D9XP83_9ORYZ
MDILDEQPVPSLATSFFIWPSTATAAAASCKQAATAVAAAAKTTTTARGYNFRWSSSSAAASFTSSSAATTYSTGGYSTTTSHYDDQVKIKPTTTTTKSTPPPPSIKKKKKKRAAAEDDVIDGGVGVAVEKESSDPRADFRESMVQMVVEMGMCHWDDLRCMLRRLLALNAPTHHAAILTAFADVCAQLTVPSPPPAYGGHYYRS